MMEEVTSATPEAWVAIPSSAQAYAQLQPGVKPAYDFGFLPAMGRLVRSHPQIGPLLMQLFGQVMFGPGALTRTEREMIAAVTAAAQDCHY
jgi:alkylhydroperoxidase/carboxymuconolactone decarboxylase family protein YurZ